MEQMVRQQKSVYFKPMKRKGFAAAYLLFFVMHLQAQHVATHQEKNVLTAAFAYTLIPAGTAQDNVQNGHFVPGIGIDYFRKVHPKFELGIMADIELGSYIIPRKEDLQRDRALVLAAIGSYAITENWAVFVGPGYEFERHKSFVIYRFGTEYLLHLNRDFFIPCGVFYDIKEGYDAWSIALGIGWHF